MRDNNLIEEKLFGRHKNFLMYCKESGKTFVEELDKEDFIAYRSEYSATREQIAELKKLLEFREQNSAKEVPVQPSISSDVDDSLQKYFCVNDIKLYEDVLISDIDFNTDVQEYLASKNYKTLAEVLSIPQQDFLPWGKYKPSSVDNFVTTLWNFFAVRRKIIPVNEINLAKKDINKFGRDAAFGLNPQIDLIIEAFEKFSVTVTLKSLINNLPNEIKAKQLNSFYCACDLEDTKSFDMLPEDLIIGDLPKYISDNSLNFNVKEIKTLTARLKKLLDFQEQNSAKKVPVQPTISNNTNDSLQKYFGVDNLKRYEDVLTSNLNFNADVQKYLASNNCKTLADILSIPQRHFFLWKKYNPNAFDNFITTLRKFFTMRRKQIFRRKVRLAKKDLDEFLCDAAFNFNPQIDLIIEAFEKFSVTVTLKSLINNLPNEIKTKHLKSFYYACDLRYTKFLGMLPENLIIGDLPEYVAENSLNFNVNEVKTFVQKLRFDVRGFTNKIILKLFKNIREFEVTRRRVTNSTLEEIGKDMGVTRERVRQLESKPVRRFAHCANDVRKICNFLYALNDGRPLLTLDDAKNFIGNIAAKMLWFFAEKVNFSCDTFYYKESLNAFVFDEAIDIDEEELTKNLPDVMEENTFRELVINLAQEKNLSVEFVESMLLRIYKHKGQIFHRGRLTLTFEYAYILKERFPNGYKIADEIFYSKLVRYLQEIFDERTPSIQRNVDSKIGYVGVLCDRGKYIHPDFVCVPPEIIESIKDFIENSNHTAIPYKEIFESLKDIFVNTQITNNYFLQGVIKLYKLPYILRKDYLTKAADIDMNKEFESFVAERGEVSIEEIKENFISFEDFNVTFLVERCPEIINIGNSTFVHSSILNLRDEDFESIKNFLLRNCSRTVNSRILFDLFFERFADFMNRNDIQNHNKLFGILKYMFSNDFNFSRPYISTADIKDITNKKFLLHLLEDTAEIGIEDIFNICDENKIHYISKNHHIDNLRPDFIRVDEFKLMRPESIGVTDEIISSVVENIRSAIERNGGYQSANTFEDYEWLPQLEIPWNSFLLENVVALSDDAPYSLRIPSTSVNISPTVFLAEEFAEDDLQSFITKILIAEHDKEPFHSEKEIFNWLQEQGLCNKKLPRFLEGGNAFDILK
ncbi:MAG: hypothetical protein K6G55_03040 [Selenomonadaceae bacterium]|nr:hypothetical protein [Selenomonadaceae bacterium]